MSPDFAFDSENTYLLNAFSSFRIGNCSGMPIQEDFDFLVKQGKDASDTNLVTAMIKYGKGDGRIPMNLTQDERKYLRTVLDPTLMRRLHYVQILVK